MKKFLWGVLALALAGVVYAGTQEDVTREGVESWFWQNITNSKIASTFRDYEDVTAVNTLLYSECGKTIFLNSATEFATTLPAPQAGCYFKFIIKAAPAGANYTIVTASSANIMIGGINELEIDTTEDHPSDDNADTITFVQALAVVGDYVEMISDGTSWYFTGQAAADGGIAPSTAG